MKRSVYKCPDAQQPPPRALTALITVPRLRRHRPPMENTTRQRRGRWARASNGRIQAIRSHYDISKTPVSATV